MAASVTGMTFPRNKFRISQNHTRHFSTQQKKNPSFSHISSLTHPGTPKWFSKSFHKSDIFHITKHFPKRIERNKKEKKKGKPFSTYCDPPGSDVDTVLTVWEIGRNFKHFLLRFKGFSNKQLKRTNSKGGGGWHLVGSNPNSQIKNSSTCDGPPSGRGTDEVFLFELAYETKIGKVVDLKESGKMNFNRVRTVKSLGLR